MPMPLRSISRKAGSYEHRYDVEAMAHEYDLDAPVLDSHSLTRHEAFANKFHNELAVLLALRDLQYVPEVLDYDRDRMTITCADLGPSLRSPEDRDLAETVEAFALIHDTWNRTELGLKDVFHAIVEQSWYFEWRCGMRDHAHGKFGDLLDEVPRIIGTAADLPRRCVHGDVNGANLFQSSHGLCLVDFEDSEMSLQMGDLVSILWQLAWSDTRYLKFAAWIVVFERYSTCLEKSSDLDYKEFLYCTIRWACRWLSKRVRSEQQCLGRPGLAESAYAELKAL